ncbi:MAG TPA: outer membrane protein assembly factor BamE [Rhodanobacteraceae bacterium]|jgi:outer membrane protein assembly factor BamE|nr:outer membrane protein assembly factor BamE [Rhodanobacteraceae bacterium]
MPKTIPTLLLATTAMFALGACNLIYRPDVQQGNLLIGKNVSELKPGLTKQQVIELLGTPSVVSPFDQNQWNYVATLQRRGGAIKERTLTLYFDNDTLVRTDGDFMKETPQELLRESHKYGPLYPTNLTKQEQKDLEKKQKQGGG